MRGLVFLLRRGSPQFDASTTTTTMKLATAALLIAPAVAFSPATSFGVRRTALNMATETAEETKVFLKSWSASLVDGV
jgi:hypothetical protein